MRHRKETFALIAVGVAIIGIGATGVAPLMRRAKTVHPRTGARLITPGKDSDSTLLFNGWRIRPVGRQLPTGDMLLGGALSPDGKTLAITNAGWSIHALQLVDVASEKLIAKISLGRAWNGIAWAPDGKRVYVAGGVSNTLNDIHVIEKGEDGAWKRGKGLFLTGNDTKQTAVAGLALSQNGKTLYVLNNSDNNLYVVDTESGTTRAHLVVGDHPVVCHLDATGKQLYVANWGGSEVVVVDVTDASHPALTTHLTTGAHPNDLALSGDGRLFVSCGNSDCVSVIDVASHAALETLKTTLTPKSPHGSTPDALALTPDNRTLYVANADNNDVCVIDVASHGKSRVRGFIPTGWYPTALAMSADGKKLLIGSGKGIGSHPNPASAPINPNFPTGFEYIPHQLNGLISFVDVPTKAGLAEYTRQVVANTPYQDKQLRGLVSERPTAIPPRVGMPSPIKYVLYIIKENRTYDQVFGDLPQGNGDPNLCLFGREVTPNQHALAEQFVLLDNLYCNGEVSEDGHPWSTSAYATDFTQRSWVLSYSAKGSTNRSDSVGDPEGGYIWDACKRHKISYRSYGEYVYATSAASAPEQKVAGSTGLLGHGSPRYVGIGWPAGKEMRDTDKADIFVDEFHEFERTGKIPQFMVMALGEDHTRGTTPGAFTPKAAVASNDAAVGKIVDVISHSPAWKQFAIFIIEDDAQNGPDHVDSHRTSGLVISPYLRRHYVDSTMYTTTSMLRTMELILGLPPLTQYDAASTPLFASFTETPDLTPFTQVRPQIDVTQTNRSTAYGAAQSAHMDWSEYDHVDEQALNRILWCSIKGQATPMPAPVRRAFVASAP